ncbi:hypothetical protein MHB65_15375 [Lysinibacillus sp. FSL K6-0075]|uniref:hypothetical protein n=1 Tax=Lysinibacillus sp. FSL K6-0075 TaxID=2921415 RepID=UPI0031584B32
MTITSQHLNERYKVFENKISDATYKALECLNDIISGEKQRSVQVFFLGNSIEYNQTPESKMKIALYYTRLCTIIENLLLEYKNYDEEQVKVIIDYYIESNAMKEMNLIGLGYYYNVKFKKDRTTLYSVSYGSESNWHTWLLENNVEENHLKENGVQLIFKACKEHINRGGNINLKSLSKGFGIDLFKYMRLDESSSAHLYIIKDAPINFIEINSNQISLQEYLQSENVFSLDNTPHFCIDFSHPRNKKPSNYNKWSKKFLKDEVYISQAEFEKRKESYSMPDDFYDIIILNWIKQERKQDGEAAISSRVSPVADKEIIVSDILWEIEDYDIGLNEEMIEQEKCYHFVFDKIEYYHLIYNYFKIYAEKKKNYRFIENYDKRMKREIDFITQELNKLNKEQEMFESLNKNEIEVEEFIQKEKNYKDNKLLIEIYIVYGEFLKSIFIDNISPKIQLALSFIDWQTEELEREWSLENIYNSRNISRENVLLNLYKIICKDAAMKGAKYGE